MIRRVYAAYVRINYSEDTHSSFVMRLTGRHNGHIRQLLWAFYCCLVQPILLTLLRRLTNSLLSGWEIEAATNTIFMLYNTFLEDFRVILKLF